MAALVDKEDVKAQLGISNTDEDTYIESQVAVYIAQLERLTGRKFGEITSFVEKGYQPVAQRRLEVRKYLPLTTINEIKVDGEVVDASNYEIEYGTVGFIRFKDGFWPTTAWARERSINSYAYQEEYLYEIDYAGGEPLPPDVYQAIIDCVVAAYSSRGMDSSISSIKVGDASTSYGNRTTTGLPNSFNSVVSAYKAVGVL